MARSCGAHERPCRGLPRGCRATSRLHFAHLGGPCHRPPAGANKLAFVPTDGQAKRVPDSGSIGRKAGAAGIGLAGICVSALATRRHPARAARRRRDGGRQRASRSWVSCSRAEGAGGAVTCKSGSEGGVIRQREVATGPAAEHARCRCVRPIVRSSSSLAGNSTTLRCIRCPQGATGGIVRAVVARLALDLRPELAKGPRPPELN